MQAVVRVLKYWPIVLFFAILPFHPDMLMATMMILGIKLDIPPYLVWMPVATFGTFKLVYTYWFIGWCWSTIRSSDFSHDVTGFLRILFNEMQAKGMLDRLKELLHDHTHVEKYKDHWAWHLVKEAGLVTIFLMGIQPFTGTRVPAMIICRIRHWKMGMAVLAVANFVRYFYLPYFLLWFFGK